MKGKRQIKEILKLKDNFWVKSQGIFLVLITKKKLILVWICE